MMKTALLAISLLAFAAAAPCHAENTEKTAPSPVAQPPKASKPSVVPKNVPDAVVPSEWKGIPTPPGALNGRPVLHGYSYAVPTLAEPIEQFYRAELTKKGWTLAQRDRTERSKLAVPAVKIEFTREQERVNIIILENEKDKNCLVVLNLRGPPEAKTDMPKAETGKQEPKTDEQQGKADAVPGTMDGGAAK